MLLAVLAVPANAADLSATYDWKPLKMGGATYFTNVWVHPTEPHLVYIDSDTAGAVRWEAAAHRWVTVTTASSMPRPPNGYFTGYPVASSLVGAPSDPNVAYQAVGDRLVNNSSGNVYRSADRARTWSLPGRFDRYVAPNSHADARDAGPRLAVDPADANIVYFGTQRDGLWRTTDGGVTWSKFTAIPTPANKGVTVVRIDPKSGTASGRTQRIYAAVHGSGIWTTEDAGQSWTNLGGIADDVHAMKIGGDGTLYAVRRDGEARRYSGGIWQTITPSGTSRLRTIAVDPQNARRVFAIGGFGGNPWLSTDRGDTWTQLTRRNGTVFPWHAQFYANGGSTQVGDVEFDILDSNRLWVGEAYGIWRGELGPGTVTWHTLSHGTEGTASHAVVKPPGGAALTGNMDLGIFHHPDPDAYTSVQCTSPSGNNFTHGWSVAYCATRPSFVAAISAPGNAFTREESGYSTAGGRQGTWVRFPSIPPYQASSPTGIAVSATDPDNIAIYDSSQNNVFVTTNRGVSWTTTSLGTPMLAHWGPGHGAVAADRVNGGTFYIYDWGNGGRFWRSNDGGSTWTMVSGDLPGAAYANIQVTPGRAGHLWWSGGIVGGTELPLYRSTDFGTSWASVPRTSFARAAAAGKAAPDATYPTVYFYGKIDGAEGVWRSTDELQSWDKIADVAPMGIYQRCLSMDADPEIFGDVYMVLSGTGSVWGHPHRAAAPPTASASNLSARAAVGSGEDVLVVGFVLAGQGERSVLVRGAGPSLAQFGVAGFLPDPQLTLQAQGGAVLAENDNWADPLVASESARLGAFSLPIGSPDAALVRRLPGGSYSATVRGTGAEPGVAIAELYDGGGDPDLRLVNISARARVGTGGDVLIGGFVIADRPTLVLVRAVGPTLATFGVQTALARPVLELVRSGESQPLASNTGWYTALNADDIASTAARVGAFPFAGGSVDSALLVRLDPGNYTAVVRGTESTGVALVEVYMVD